MPAGNSLCVPDPATDHMDGKVLEQLGFPGRTKVLPHLRPRVESGPLNEPNELCVRVVPGQDERQKTDLLGRSFLERVFDERPQLRPEWDDTLGLALLFGFGRCDRDTAALQVDV